MDKRRVRVLGRMGLYVVAACLAVIAVVFVRSPAAGGISRADSLTVLVASVVAFLLAVPSGLALVMAKE